MSATSEQYSVTFDAKGKLILPARPAHDDVAALCAWLTCVFNLDRTRPITRGRREGLAGPDGHVALTRLGAPAIRFEPATKINAPTKLIETLSWQLERTDREVHAFTGAHCRQIAHVIRVLCDTSATITDAQETAAIVRTFLERAQAVEGLTTYGTSAQRFEAAEALGNYTTGWQVGPPRYLIDENTGECVIRVSDLQETARRLVGSLPRGWLDARMQSLGWGRFCLEGRAMAGRAGRRGGPHPHPTVYRGLLPATDDIDPSGVTP